MFSHRKIAESSCFFCSVIFLGGWLSIEPNFEAQPALRVPQRAFRPSFSDPSHSKDRRFDLAGSAFDFDRLSAADRCRSFASVHAFDEIEKQKNWLFWVQTGSLEHWGSRHFGLLSRPGPCGSQRAFRPFFRTPHTQEVDGLTLPGRPSTLVGCRPRIDAVLSPVFGK